MPPLLGDIVRETLTTLDDVEILADVSTRDEIGDAVRRTDAHVAILGVSSRDPTGLSSLLGELLADHPRLTVIALARDGRNGHVYQMQPSSVAIEDLTPQSLVETIRATSGAGCTSSNPSLFPRLIDSGLGPDRRL